MDLYVCGLPFRFSYIVFCGWCWGVYLPFVWGVVKLKGCLGLTLRSTWPERVGAGSCDLSGQLQGCTV